MSHFCPFQHMLLLLSVALTAFAHDGEHPEGETGAHSLAPQNAPTKTMPMAVTVTAAPTAAHEHDGNDMTGHQGHNHDSMTTQGTMPTILVSGAITNGASLMGLVISMFL